MLTRLPYPGNVFKAKSIDYCKDLNMSTLKNFFYTEAKISLFDRLKISENKKYDEIFDSDFYTKVYKYAIACKNKRCKVRCIDK